MSLHSKEIKSNIESSLNSFNLDFDISLSNNDMCISVLGDDVGMWIRLLPTKDDKVRVEFSVVQLADKFQNRGIFTTVFNNLKQLDCIGVLVILSVLSDAMDNWCRKNSLVSTPSSDYYLCL